MKLSALITFIKVNTPKMAYIMPVNHVTISTVRNTTLKNREYYLPIRKEYSKVNKERISEYTKKWREENADRIAEVSKKWANKNKEKIRIDQYNIVHNDIQTKLSINLRSRLNKVIKKKYRTSSAVSDLGYSIEELKKHFESQFTEGMTWENYGRDG